MNSGNPVSQTFSITLMAIIAIVFVCLAIGTCVSLVAG